jgi:hypothetical protein
MDLQRPLPETYFPSHWFWHAFAPHTGAWLREGIDALLDSSPWALEVEATSGRWLLGRCLVSRTSVPLPHRLCRKEDVSLDPARHLAARALRRAWLQHERLPSKVDVYDSWIAEGIEQLSVPYHGPVWQLMASLRPVHGIILATLFELNGSTFIDHRLFIFWRSVITATDTPWNTATKSIMPDVPEPEAPTFMAHNLKPLQPGHLHLIQVAATQRLTDNNIRHRGDVIVGSPSAFMVNWVLAAALAHWYPVTLSYHSQHNLWQRLCELVRPYIQPPDGGSGVLP